VLRRGPEEADAENVRVAVLLDELDFPGAHMQLKLILGSPSAAVFTAHGPLVMFVLLGRCCDIYRYCCGVHTCVLFLGCLQLHLYKTVLPSV
jgi:hypothetical protein